MRPDRLVAPALGALWTHRSKLSFAWDVLRHGACADCSLGSSGLTGVVPGRHLCGRRLDRLSRETAPAFSPGLLEHPGSLRGLSARALRGLGRIPRPMIRRGSDGFHPISWADATNLAAARFRDERAEARWGLRVDPHGLDLETLFQLARFADRMERRRERRESTEVPLIDLAVPAGERTLRRAARAALGHASSSASSVELSPGDRALLVSDGDQPLFGEVVASLEARGVLVERRRADHAEERWPSEVRHTLVFGRSGTVGALAAGLPLQDLATPVTKLSALYLVGDLAARWTTGWESVPVRVHQASFLDPTMLTPAPEAVLLLPASPNADLPGGGSHLSDDLIVRYSAQVVGSPGSDAKPHWESPVLIGALADTDIGDALAAHDSTALRSALAASRPGLAGVLGLSAPADSFRLPAPVP
ncbi:MAG: hypothetical protein KDA24_00415 [Deltaproteobacteria bacterium]|nr:hypothetical protein [Deltaproteobacteria bacterium]